ncbi:MAG: hypothetical protein RSD49_12000 [Hafnia sp.]
MDVLRKSWDDDVIDRVDQCSVYPLSEDDLATVKDAVAQVLTGQCWPQHDSSLSRGTFRREMVNGLNKRGFNAQYIRLSTHRLLQVHELMDSAASRVKVYTRTASTAKRIGNRGAYTYFNERRTRWDKIFALCERRLNEQA